ncbi:DUF6445 family protein [Aurantiacibacter poecillastricola]|uniref:DUF6445 family protein n=1 Tax=Aurantiacibacter poecillastricola TaxID=3064385 RepID=UPI00273F95FA|nr:DUF6445 family protein [Aurantiacibacter sp. 219JJ12-13]MDP5263085.1 DUF6445 family protein [Aurantiacibacter sp. 219JJ12-13]
MAIIDGDLTIHQFGQEREPVVQINNFSGIAGELLEAARAAQYAPAGAYYPGIRARVDPSYLDRNRALFVQVLGRVFGFTRTVRCDSSAFSIVTTPPGELAPLQRIPHHDQSGGQIVAIMHYLQGPESGGTAFYRHRRTGFETITPPREQAFLQALAEDEREFGEPEAGYYHGSGERYEMIGEIEAQPDRLILYRGQLLHSGVIPDPARLSADPAKGRVTINMFFVGS